MNQDPPFSTWKTPALALLPTMTALVGRDGDLDSLINSLSNPSIRLLSLTGPGGVGKTRLAIAVIERLRPMFGGRTQFISLAAVTDPALLLGEIARTVGIHHTGALPPLESIARSLGPERALLALDNMEQIVESAPMLLDLLQELPALQLLVTSREALRVRAEHVHPVAPLGLAGSLGDTGELALSEAGALFLTRAQADNGLLKPTEADLATINAICERLDGLPLAIELAAARARLLAPAELLARLDDPLRILVRGARDLPERQRTMRDAIAWSFGLLDPDERMLFELLSVFSGGAPLAAIEELWPVWLQEASSGHVLDLLESLISKSLVSPKSGADGETRYLMLETLREFGLDTLRTHHHLDRARAIHADWYLALGEASIPELSGSGRSLWLDRLERELANLRAAMTWILATNSGERGLRAIEALWRFWESRGHMPEGDLFAGRALAFVEAVRDSYLRASALYGASMLSYRLGRYEIASIRAEECLAIFLLLEDADGIARGLNGCALIAFERGDFERSERAHRESLARSEQLEMNARISTTCVNLGILYYEDGRYDDAWTVYQRAFDLNTTPDRAYDRAFALNGLGIVSHRRGDLTLAKGHLAAAIEIRRNDRDSGALAASLTNLAMVHIDDNNLIDALALLLESVAMRWNRAELRGLNEAFAGIARILATGRRYEESARLIGTVDMLAERGHRLPRPIAAELLQTRTTVRRVLPADRFEAAIRLGRTLPLTETVAGALAIVFTRQPAGDSRASSPHPLLTPREIDVLRLIAEGQSDRQIAESLEISRNTVIRHVANIFLKLEVNSRTLAAMYAFNHGLVLDNS